MSVYYIANMEVFDEATYKENRKTGQARSNASITSHNGKVLAADSDFKILDGTNKSTRIIIIEFETEEDLNAWYNSAEYTEIKKVRDTTTNANVVMLHGV